MTVGHNGINEIRNDRAEWSADDTAPARHTADTITDDELDALYERLAKAERAVNLLADSHRHAEQLEAEVQRYAAVVRRLDQMATAWQERLPEAIRTEVAVDAIRVALEPVQRLSAATDPDSRTVAAP